MRIHPAAILFVLLVPFVARAGADECDYVPSQCESYARADAVFVGEVKRIVPEYRMRWQTDADYDQTAYVNVEKTYKGLKGVRRVVLRQLGRRRAQKFINNSRYLFYANYDRARKIWEVRPCGRTRLEDYVQADLRYLGGLPANAGRTRVAGEISSFDPDGTADQDIPRLGGIKLKLTGAGREYALSTDADGAYEIFDLPPGGYTIQLSLPDGLVFYGAMHTGRFPLSRLRSLKFELSEGACAEVNILLRPDKSPAKGAGSRAGRVTESGESK